jgi:hypothetical protein
MGGYGGNGQWPEGQEQYLQQQAAAAAQVQAQAASVQARAQAAAAVSAGQQVQAAQPHQIDLGAIQAQLNAKQQQLAVLQHRLEQEQTNFAAMTKEQQAVHCKEVAAYNERQEQITKEQQYFGKLWADQQAHVHAYAQQQAQVQQQAQAQQQQQQVQVQQQHVLQQHEATNNV